jgi:hypothetical protein
MAEVATVNEVPGAEAEAAAVRREWLGALPMPAAARELGLPLSSLHRHARAGRVRVMRMFGVIRVPRREICRILLELRRR